jgi:hypothetical protein
MVVPARKLCYHLSHIIGLAVGQFPMSMMESSNNNRSNKPSPNTSQKDSSGRSNLPIQPRLSTVPFVSSSTTPIASPLPDINSYHPMINLKSDQSYRIDVQTFATLVCVLGGTNEVSYLLGSHESQLFQEVRNVFCDD